MARAGKLVSGWDDHTRSLDASTEVALVELALQHDFVDLAQLREGELLIQEAVRHLRV